jgi:phosphatidylethanolamine-binding protein (PEBP) family uncharacterized protein
MIADTLIRAASLLTTIGLATGATGEQFTLTSADFSPGGTLNDEQAFDGMGCTGQNVSPALRWAGAPAGTKSYALLLHDPDAPTGGAGWWHWIAYDIPANATGTAPRCRRAPRASPTITARRDTAGPARPPATSRTATCSRFMR